jgi:hypothetical protein
MRADAHYVDQLATRRDVVHSDAPPRTRRSEAIDPAADRDRRDGPETDAPAPRALRPDWLLAQLVADVTAIQAAAALIAGESSPLARRATVDAIRAHAWRAAFLLHAQALVDGTHRTQVRTRRLAGLLGQLRDGFAPECRLTGLELLLATADWNGSVAIDEAAMVAATTGAVLASIALLPETSGAVIRIAAATHGGELRAVDVIQEEAPVPASLSARFFDAGWAERPGGPIAALGAACVKVVAALHGGEAAFMAGARRGSTIRINLAVKGSA